LGGLLNNLFRRKVSKSVLHSVLVGTEVAEGAMTALGLRKVRKGVGGGVRKCSWMLTKNMRVRLNSLKKCSSSKILPDGSLAPGLASDTIGGDDHVTGSANKTKTVAWLLLLQCLKLCLANHSGAGHAEH
jgi:hypothetical protein